MYKGSNFSFIRDIFVLRGFLLVNREPQPQLARASLESAICRAGACQHRTVASCNGREKSTGGAGPPVVVGWSDLAKSAVPRPRPGGLHLRRSNRWLLPLRIAKCVCEIEALGGSTSRARFLKPGKYSHFA